jgi:peroxiredoxin
MLTSLIALLVLGWAADDGARPSDDRSAFEMLLKEFPGPAGRYIRNDEQGRAASARFFAFASEHRDAPESLKALGWVASHRVFSADAGRAMAWIAKDYSKSPNLSPILLEIDLMYGDPFEPNESMLRTILKDTPHPEVRGTSALCLAREIFAKRRKAEREARQYALIEKGANVPFVDKPEATGADLDRWSDEAAALCESIVGEPSYPARIRDDAEATFREIRDLAIGKRAPEIQGRDHEGNPFQLSDYRGKVVLLTFDASGCGGCVAMYPLKRQMIDRYKGRPFASVSVYADDNLGYLKKAIAAGEITWRAWCDGGADGPISRRWNIHGYPTIFVLDGEGVIRHRVDHGLGLETVIETMVAEAETKGGR